LAGIEDGARDRAGARNVVGRQTQTYGQLLTEREIFERDRAVSAADQADRLEKHHKSC
jgi:hypothetical protein